MRRLTERHWLQACNRQTAYCVPLYDTLGPDAVEYIIGHAGVTIVFASALKMRALVEPLSRAKGAVKAVIVWGDIDGIAKMVRSAASSHHQLCCKCGQGTATDAATLHVARVICDSMQPSTCGAPPMVNLSALVRKNGSIAY